VCEDFITTLDLLPTFAALSGKSLSHAVDGFDVSPVLLGEAGAKSPRTSLYSLYGYKERRLESFREGSWKLHLTTPPELYDLGADLSESRNLVAEHGDIVTRLAQRAEDVRQETKALPTSASP
jgi:arylsulfatase A-like enzyme